MINTNELRLNNFISTGILNYRVNVIDECVLSLIRNEETSLVKPNEVFGIPLTPEILQKAGFRKFGLTDYIIGKLNTFMSLAKNEHGYINPSCHTNILYLHQLQNLYFAQTGEELQINF